MKDRFPVHVEKDRTLRLTTGMWVDGGCERGRSAACRVLSVIVRFAFTILLTQPMIRRQFVATVVRSGAAGLVAGAGITGSLSGCSSEVINGMDRPPLASILGTAGVRALGESFLKVGSVDGAEQLNGAIQAAASQLRRYPWSPLPDMSQLISSDFANGRTVFVDGWLLSVNEARQYALLALATA